MSLATEALPSHFMLEEARVCFDINKDIIHVSCMGDMQGLCVKIARYDLVIDKSLPVRSSWFVFDHGRLATCC